MHNAGRLLYHWENSVPSTENDVERVPFAMPAHQDFIALGWFSEACDFADPQGQADI